MPTPRPFRFGVLGESLRTPQDLRETVRRAEATGCSTFLIRDHLIEAPFGHQLAPLISLATVAASSSLRIGTVVLDNDFRHPVMLAKEAATLDLLSGGRLELGIGAGWLRAEYDEVGMTYDRAGVRISRLEESLAILTRLLAGETVTYSGQHYSVTDHATFPLPMQRPRPPLLIGAGEPRMLALAGRQADIVSIMGSSVASGAIAFDPAQRTPERMRERVERVRQAAGERFAAIELSMNIDLIVTNSPRQVAAELAARAGGAGYSADDVLRDPTIFLGSVDAIAATMEQRRESLGFSYFVIADADLAAASPVIQRLAGR